MTTSERVSGRTAWLHRDRAGRRRAETQGWRRRAVRWHRCLTRKEGFRSTSGSLLRNGPRVLCHLGGGASAERRSPRLQGVRSRCWARRSARPISVAPDGACSGRGARGFCGSRGFWGCFARWGALCAGRSGGSARGVAADRGSAVGSALGVGFGWGLGLGWGLSFGSALALGTGAPRLKAARRSSVGSVEPSVRDAVGVATGASWSMVTPLATCEGADRGKGNREMGRVAPRRDRSVVRFSNPRCGST